MVKLNLLICGVGGQGIITMGRMLVEASFLSGLKATVAETHGLSQRGGAVNVHVRIGDVYYPLIPVGGADYLIALEAVEALRNIQYANKRTVIILNERVERPVLPKIKVPSLEEVKRALSGLNIISVNADELANKAGNIKAVNAVMIGVLMSKLNGLINEEAVLKVLRNEVNQRAYKLGKEVALAIIESGGTGS